MTDQALLGPWVRRFLLEYLVTEKNLARNTQRSYGIRFACCFRSRPRIRAKRSTSST
jgi:hypothetical protein